VLRLSGVVTILFAGLAGVFAQVAPGEPPVSGNIASTTAPPVASAPAGAPQMVRLQYPNSDVADILRLYEQLTGKKLVMDNFVQGKVTIFLSKDVPVEEAIKIIEMNLLMNGFSLVPSENDIVKVIGTGRNPRATGVPVISDESEIPSGDHVISFLFKLRYADANELQIVLSQYLQPPSTYTSILALPKASSILITENSSVIRSLVHIVNQIDAPPAEVVSEFIKLERADVKQIVEMLDDIFEKGQSPNVKPGPGGVRAVRAPVPQQIATEGEPGAMTALTALSEDSVVVGKIKITADVRTNRIHVVTRPINMPFIRKLIGEFDANVEFAKPVTRPLKYISAGEILPVLVQALTEPGSDQKGEGATGQNLAPQQQQQQQRRNSTTGQYGGTSGTGSDSSGGSLNVSEELSTTAVDTTPKAVTIGNAKIIADQRANSIIMLGNREVVMKVQKILDEMDVKAPQVALSTVIGELTLNNDETLGVDIFQRLGKRVAGTTNFTGIPPAVGGGTTTTNNATTPPTVTTTGGNVFFPGTNSSFTQLATNAASGANAYLAVGSSLAAVVHALNSNGKFKVISRPMVFTSNNKKAIIASGTEIPVPTTTLTNAAVGTTTTTNNVASVASSVEFKKVALQLEVVPLINSEKEVSLDILQKIDSLVSGGNVNISGNSIPTIATRYIRTNVTAPNGGTIILGGLIQDNKGTNNSGIPYLDKIPLVGALFRNTSKTHSRTELIVLMRPEVTLTNLDMYRLRVKNEQKTHLGSDLDEQEPVTPETGKELPPPDLPPQQ
jgi:general secretion pathway protein D